MAKRGLGKGLGQLMNGQSVAGPSAPPEASPDRDTPGKVTAVDFGRGLSTLVGAREPDKQPTAKSPWLLPAWFFFAADVLLLAYTIAICFGARGALQSGEIVFALASTSLGAALAILGVLRAAAENQSH
jgi:hypothetical protein